MPYKKIGVNDIKGWLEYQCPCCWDFRAKTKRTVLKHLDECDDNRYQGEHPDNIIIGNDAEDEEHMTAGIIINDRDIVNKTIIKFIKSNELEGIANRTGREIREYIKQKLNRIGDRCELNNYTYHIYRLFFDMTDEDKQMEKTEVDDPMIERVLAMI